ncbi:hypothetical protein GY12_18540 [Micrococcus luteus]|nr:hypothetical protein GY12_18540 [Micrococcus luteus]
MISGPTPLHGVEFDIPDLRGGFSPPDRRPHRRGHLLTGLEIINRGYEHFMAKLEGLGADVELTERDR